MDAQTSLRVHGLRREMLASRRRGRVIVEFDDGIPYTTAADARLAADQMISMVNLPMMGPHWVSVDQGRTDCYYHRRAALGLGTFGQRVPEAEALELTNRFLAECGGEVCHLPHQCPIRGRPCLSPLTDGRPGSEQNELDAGVVVVSPKLVGMFWGRRTAPSTAGHDPLDATDALQRSAPQSPSQGAARNLAKAAGRPRRSQAQIHRRAAGHARRRPA